MYRTSPSFIRILDNKSSLIVRCDCKKAQFSDAQSRLTERQRKLIVEEGHPVQDDPPTNATNVNLHFSNIPFNVFLESTMMAIDSSHEIEL